jgi:O-antigen/teichoic acid export membrane protein
VSSASESSASESSDASGRDGETPTERADRNFSDLLEELRVAQTGVQILVAFLLTIPFQQRFPQLSPALRRVYDATLTSAVLAAVLLIAPVAFHRGVFREHRKAGLVQASHRLAIAGLALLAVAITGSVTLALSFASGWALGLVVGAVVALTVILTWVVGPLRLRSGGLRGRAPGT